MEFIPSNQKSVLQSIKYNQKPISKDYIVLLVKSDY